MRCSSGAISDYSAWIGTAIGRLEVLIDAYPTRRSQAKGDFKLHEPHTTASENRRLCGVRVSAPVIGARYVFRG